LLNKFRSWYEANADKVDRIIVEAAFVVLLAVADALATENRRLRDEHFDYELRALTDGR
jgi:hypothetical protein